ncbi:DNA-processing protein DprA [Spirosoma lituiforme]
MKISQDTVVKIMSLPSVGRRTAFRLLKSLNYSVNSDNDLVDFVNENSKLLRSPLSAADFKVAFDKAENIISQSERAGIKLISYFDVDYPTLLSSIDDPALLLSVKGPFKQINQMPSVAIIGTRGPSEFGYKIGVRLGEVFGEAGFNVVSGLAIGCDTAGHTGCLNRYGFTTAVLAHGLDTIYPKENKQLAAQILDSGGLLISEYLIGQRPQANYFVERDRIQAGLSQAVIVVETDIKGGTMHTVKFANNNKRIVAAFNHESKYLSHPKTQGNQYLILNKKAIPLSNAVSIEHLKAILLDLSGYVLPKLPSLVHATSQEPPIPPAVIETPCEEDSTITGKDNKKNTEISKGKEHKKKKPVAKPSNQPASELPKKPAKVKAGISLSTEKTLKKVPKKAALKANKKPTKTATQLDISF